MQKISLLLLAILILNSCKKEEEDSRVFNEPNVTLDFFENNLNNSKQVFTVDLTNTTWLSGSKGTYIIISPCSFLDVDGNEVLGEIEFELIEAQTNIDMLKLNRPTFTKDGQLLVSGGVLYINANKDGEPLNINPNCALNVYMPDVNSNYAGGDMQYFSGETDDNGVFAWDLEDDTVTVQAWDNDNGDAMVYGFNVDSVGWINCDYFYNWQGDLTGVEVQMPQGYNGSNSQVFIHYNSINSIAGLNDFNQDGIFDLGSGYETPVGMGVKFIALSGDSLSGYYFDTVSSIISLNHNEVISIMNPISSTDLQDLLNNL